MPFSSSPLAKAEVQVPAVREHSQPGGLPLDGTNFTFDTPLLVAALLLLREVASLRNDLKDSISSLKEIVGQLECRRAGRAGQRQPPPPGQG